MKKRSVLHIASALFLLITTLGLSADPASVSAVSQVAAGPNPPVTRTIRPPLIIDGEDGRLYGTVLENGQEHHIAVFSGRDGRLLTTFPFSTPFALDAEGNRLFVIVGRDQVAIVDSRSGRTLRTFQVDVGGPDASLGAAPQYDIKTGHLLLFAGNAMLVVDPDTGKRLSSTSFAVPSQDRCRMPTTEGLPINRSYLDPDTRLLYVEFTTYSCIPWIGLTIVSFDLAKGVEVSRQGTEPYSGLAAGGGFYAESWMRFGIGTLWSEREGKPSSRTSGWSSGAGFALDTRRELLYQSAEGSIRIMRPSDMVLLEVVPQPVKGALAAYDAVSDRVYFVDGQTVRPWPAARLAPLPAGTLTVQKPPRDPVSSIVPSPGWERDATLFAVWSQPWPQTTCYVFGQSGGSLFQSRDGGKQWLRGQAGLPTDCGLVSALAVSPAFAQDQTLLAGVKGNGVFKSTDGGKTWKPSGAGLPYVGVNQLVLSPGYATDKTLFATASDNGLQRSTDGGTSWQTLGTGANPVVALSPEFDRDKTLAVYGYVSGTPVLQFSADGGETWQNVKTPPPGDGLRLLSLAPAFGRWRVMFAGGLNGDIYRSADAGESWQRVLQVGQAQVPGTGADRIQIAYGPNEEQREVFLVVSGVHYAGENRTVWGELYRSHDGGQTWSEMDAGPGSVPTALAMSPSYAQDHTLLLGTADGRVRSFRP